MLGDTLSLYTLLQKEKCAYILSVDVFTELNLLPIIYIYNL